MIIIKRPFNEGEVEKGYFKLRMITKNISIIFLFIISLQNFVQSQELNNIRPDITDLNVRPLLVGERVPKDFWSREHLFYLNGDTVRRNLSAYQGKLIIFDFWATWCGACKAWFPTNEKLQKEFGGDLEIILVNSDLIHDDIKKIGAVLSDEQFFENQKGKSIIFDTYLKSLFPHNSIPRYIWVDPKGMVRAITTMDFLSFYQIKTILSRKEFNTLK